MLSSIDSRLNAADHAFGNFVLDGEDVIKRPIVALCPEVITGLRLDELPGDPYAVAVFSDAALKYITYTELASNLAHIHVAPFVAEARVARDHEKPFQPRETGEDVFDDPISEVFLFRIAAHVEEGEDGDRRFVW